MASNKDKELRELREEIKKLKRELKEKDEKIQGLADKSVVERWKIGKYLHDNLAQQLTSAKLSIRLLKEKPSKEKEPTCDEVVDILDGSIQDVRDLSHDVIPIDVEKERIEEALIHLKVQAERQHSITCRLETDGIVQKINSRKVATNLYHIAQEAIKNAVNHGDATHIKIALIEHRGQLYLHIKDDGKGFDPEHAKGGMGITIMKHRAEEIGGTCRIKGADGSSEYNTLVTCKLPADLLQGG